MPALSTLGTRAVIVLNTETSLPEVYINGERQTGLISIDFHYRTGTGRSDGVTHFHIEHAANTKEAVLTQQQGFTHGFKENIDKK